VEEKKTIQNLWRIAMPIRRPLLTFLGLLIVYEGAQVLESYVISGSIRLYQNDISYEYWLMFFAVLIIHDELFMRLDNNIDWHVITKLLYPLSRWVKFQAVAKFLGLDMRWHQEHNSGTLVGKVNNGVGKIEDILNNMCWEFLPTFTQTVLSLIPLMFFSPFTALIAVIAFTVFMAISVVANKRRQPLRSKRHDLYEDEWQMSTESVRSVETATMFNQQERMLRAYDGIHEKIFDVGFKEARQGVVLVPSRRSDALGLAAQRRQSGCGQPGLRECPDRKVVPLVLAIRASDRKFHRSCRRCEPGRDPLETAALHRGFGGGERCGGAIRLGSGHRV
jgi:ABC-type multidrug transport system fused ATPase/permease subunit